MRYVHKTCPCGELRGIGTDSYLLFKSVRYALAERWEATEEITGWNGTYDATVPTPYCFQYNTFIAEKTATGRFYSDEVVEKPAIIYSEDCLRLNSEIDERISANMVEYFANFAKTGVPFGDGLATWDPITEDNSSFMHFGDDPCEMCSVPEEHLMNVQNRGKPFPGM